VATPRDVIVIGAGIVGCAVAYELARRGASVEIIDDRPAGAGATHASAGVLGPYVEAREEGPLLDLTSRSLGLFDNFIAAISADSGAPVMYKRTGTLDVATTPDGLRILQGTAAVLDKRGVAAELLDARAIHDVESHLPADALGGLLIPSHGFVSALDLTKALVQKKYDAKKMVETAEHFFVSLGMSPLPPTFWQRSLLEKPREKAESLRICEALHKRQPTKPARRS